MAEGDKRIAFLDAEGRIERFELVAKPGYEPEGLWVQADMTWRVGGTISDGVYTPPAMSAEDVASIKAEAARRIEAAYPLWWQINITREGGEALEAMGAAIDLIRSESNEIEAMTSLPDDFTADAYWA